MRYMQIIAAALAFGPVMALADGQVWVTNEKDNTVSVIDVATMEVVATHPTGERPRGAVFSHDYARLYICASDSDTVQVMDPATGAIIAELPSGDDPEQFALHPDDRRLYIANEDDALATVVDTETGEVLAEIKVGIEPEGVGASPDGRFVVVTSETTSMAHWIDTESQKIVANTLVDNRPRHAEFTPDSKELWVSAEIGGTVTVFSSADQTEIAKINFEIKGLTPDQLQPVGVRFAEKARKAFVALGTANHVAVVNVDTYEVEDYLLVGSRVWHIAVTGDEKYLFTTNGASGDVTVIDIASMTPVKSIKVGRYPWGAAWRP